MRNVTDSAGELVQRAHSFMQCEKMYADKHQNKLKERPAWAGVSSQYFDRCVEKEWTPEKGVPESLVAREHVLKLPPGKRCICFPLVREGECTGADPLKQLLRVSHGVLEQVYLELIGSDRESQSECEMSFYSRVKLEYFHPTAKSAMSVKAAVRLISATSVRWLENYRGPCPSEYTKQRVDGLIMVYEALDRLFDIQNGKPTMYSKTGPPKSDDTSPEAEKIRKAFDEAKYIRYDSPVLQEILRVPILLVDWEDRIRIWVAQNREDLTKVNIVYLPINYLID
jgi:hypothetical protein